MKYKVTSSGFLPLTSQLTATSYGADEARESITENEAASATTVIPVEYFGPALRNMLSYIISKINIMKSYYIVLFQLLIFSIYFLKTLLELTIYINFRHTEISSVCIIPDLYINISFIIILRSYALSLSVLYNLDWTPAAETKNKGVRMGRVKAEEIFP